MSAAAEPDQWQFVSVTLVSEAPVLFPSVLLLVCGTWQTDHMIHFPFLLPLTYDEVHEVCNFLSASWSPAPRRHDLNGSIRHNILSIRGAMLQEE